MLGDLERPDATLMAHVLAAAWRLRSGAPGAREDLLTALRTAGQAFENQTGNLMDLVRPFLEALRALYLYG